MTVNEFNIQFDVLYNNITSNQAPGLNEYEKSVFLTKAQSEIVKNYFLATHNAKQEGYMDSPKREHDFSNIIVHRTYTDAANGTPYYYNSNKSILFAVPDNMFLALSEQLIENVSLNSTKLYTIVPLEYQEFSRLMRKPYKLPLKDTAWKLDHNSIVTTQQSTEYVRQVEFIGDFKDKSSLKYDLVYIKTLQPIILMNLAEYNVTIRGEYTPLDDTGESISEAQYDSKSPCMLPEELHEEILQRAVEIAKGVWQGDIQFTMELGNRSE